MTNIDIIQRLVKIHNNIIQIPVSGEGAILMGESIKDIRVLLQDLDKDAKNQQ